MVFIDTHLRSLGAQVRKIMASIIVLGCDVELLFGVRSGFLGFFLLVTKKASVVCFFLFCFFKLINKRWQKTKKMGK